MIRSLPTLPVGHAVDVGALHFVPTHTPALKIVQNINNSALITKAFTIDTLIFGVICSCTIVAT